MFLSCLSVQTSKKLNNEEKFIKSCFLKKKEIRKRSVFLLKTEPFIFFGVRQNVTRTTEPVLWVNHFLFLHNLKAE